MARETVADQEFTARVATLAPGFTPRMTRELRESGILTSGGSGGRGKLTPYTLDDERTAAAWQRAKADPDYRGYSDHAVLIAYAREAPVRTDGLRWAWRKCYDRQRKQITRQAGMRVREPSWADAPSSVRRSLSRVMEATEYGEAPQRDSLRTLMDYRTPDILESLGRLSEVPASSSAGITELPAAESLTSAVTTALVEWQATSDGRLELANYLGTGMALIVAQDASREVLDEARNYLLELRATTNVEPFSGLSDLELATSVPRIALMCGLHDGRRRRSPSRQLPPLGAGSQ